MRRSDPSLSELLFQEPHRFDFFQAVRLLERIETDRCPVGQDGPPRREVARFVGHLALSFPASAVYSLDKTAPLPPGTPGIEDLPSRMCTPFMGLIGPLGALPTVYTETLIGMNRKLRVAPLDFFDLFHHRLVSLFYRAWEKYNIPTLWEQGQQTGGGRVGTDRFTRHIFDVIGLGAEPLRDQQHFRDESLLYYAGIFAQQHRSAVMLERLLIDYFGHPAAVVTFFGQWLRLEPAQQSRMGRTGQFNRLGIETVAGQKVWDDQGKFRVRLGPLDFDEFRDFLPGGRLSDILMDLVRFYVRVELDFDVQLILKAEEVPWCHPSRDPRRAAQLGRSSWLKCREFSHDAEDAVFKPRDARGDIPDPLSDRVVPAERPRVGAMSLG
jgi:type VI secretion system protein ImpH